MIVSLRDGDVSAPLFLFPGAGANPQELSALAMSIRSGRAMLGLQLLQPDAQQHPITVSSIAEACYREIKKIPTHGAYCLAGYSFGGLVAVEVARKLRDAGDNIGLVAVIDTILDYRNWPTNLFLMAQLRRAYWHLQRIRRLPPSDAVKELTFRSQRLATRFSARRVRDAQLDHMPISTVRCAQDQCMTALRHYVPAYYPGTLTVLSAEDEDFACDPAAIWRQFANKVEQRRIPASHLGLVREERGVACLAAALDEYLCNV